MAAFREWERAIPATLRQDTLWRVAAYRLSLYAAELADEDGRAVAREVLYAAVAAQLIGATSSIGANIAEGYSRAHPRDRARFFEYALGSARESRHWYVRVRRAIGSDSTMRLDLLAEVIRLLLVMIPTERRRADDLHRPRAP